MSTAGSKGSAEPAQGPRGNNASLALNPWLEITRAGSLPRSRETGFGTRIGRCHGSSGPGSCVEVKSVNRK
jgi:hypothetical protein